MPDSCTENSDGSVVCTQPGGEALGNPVVQTCDDVANFGMCMLGSFAGSGSDANTRPWPPALPDNFATICPVSCPRGLGPYGIKEPPSYGVCGDGSCKDFDGDDAALASHGHGANPKPGVSYMWFENYMCECPAGSTTCVAWTPCKP